MASFGLKCDGADRRSARRMRVLQQAKVVNGPDIVAHCEVRDLSAGGAKIAVAQHAALPETFQLYICAHDLRVRSAWLRWRKGNLAGVSFAPPARAVCRSPIQVRIESHLAPNP